MKKDATPTKHTVLAGPDTLVLCAVTLCGPLARGRDQVQLQPALARFTNTTDAPLTLTGAAIDPLRHNETGAAVASSLTLQMPNQALAPGESVALTLDGDVPARAGTYLSTLRLGLAGGSVESTALEIRVAAHPVWGFCCLLLGLVMIGLGSVMDTESSLRRTLHEALQLRQEVHEMTEPVPAPLVGLLPIDEFDHEFDQAVDLLSQRRHWSFVDHRATDAKPHLNAAKQAASKIREKVTGNALGAADYADLDQQWTDLKQTFESLSKQFPTAVPQDDSFAARLDAFDAWAAQRLLISPLGYAGIVFPYDLARVRLLYAASRDVDAANLANTVRRDLRRYADLVREQAERLAFFRQIAARNLATVLRLRTHLSSPEFSPEQRDKLTRALDEATGLLHPPYTWPLRRVTNLRIEEITTEVFRVEAAVVSDAVKAAKIREEAEDSIDSIQEVRDQGASLPKGADGKTVPEAKFAWLQRLAAAWRERLASVPEPNPPAMVTALEAFDRAIASRNLDDISASLKALYNEWQRYGTNRALTMIAQVYAPFSLRLREDIFVNLEAIQEGLQDLGAHPQQAEWENQWEALRMKAAATPDLAEQMNSDIYNEMSDLSTAVFALSNRVDSARWDKAALSPSAKRWLLAEVGDTLTENTRANLQADTRVLRVTVLTPAAEQYAGREIRFQISNSDPAWRNGVQLTLDFGDGAPQTLTAEELAQNKSFAHTFARKANYALSAYAMSCANPTATGKAVPKLGATPEQSPQALRINESPVSAMEKLADRFFNIRYGLALLIAVVLYFWRFQARTKVFGASSLDYAQAFTLGFAASLAVNAPNTIAGLFS